MLHGEVVSYPKTGVTGLLILYTEVVNTLKNGG
jgi:hypothetical protein